MLQYRAQLGRMSSDGFNVIETPMVGGSDFERVKEAAIRQLTERGPAIGADRLRLVSGSDAVVWEHP